jgi:uracil permease
VLSLGLSSGITIPLGSTSITLTSLAVASIAGILINVIFPEKDFDPAKAFASVENSAQINTDPITIKRTKLRKKLSNL